ncbi:MAG: TRAP transporter substrate-binding protein DctP [Gemmatimonadales bacterium]|nr:TRAP transporter substrate-binding protein DctP [Gemmatimonadales bacterium]
MNKTLIGAALAAAIVAAPAAAQTTYRVGDSFPTGHYIAENTIKPFMAEVEKRSNGQAKFEYFPAQQLGKAKDLMSLALSGVADIAYVAPSFVSDKLPLSVVAELPEPFGGSCQGTRAYWKLVKEGGLLDEVELKPAGLKVLFTVVLDPYQLFVTKGHEISGLASFAGKKVRTSGGAKELALRKIGAVPVQIPTPEVREAAARGTIDGYLFPASSIMPYDIAPHTSFATTGENFGSFVVQFVMSRKKWESLPADLRKIMDEVGEEVVEGGCKNAEETTRVDTAKIEAAGVKFVKLPQADHDKVVSLMSEVGKEWAADLDKRGRKGTEVLQAFQKGLADAR